MHRYSRAAVGGAAAVAAVALTLAGCAGGGPSEPNGEETTAAGVTYMDMSTGECAAPPIEGVDFEGAQAYLAQFEAPVTSLLTNEKLPEPISPDTLVVYVDNGSPYGGILSENIQAAAESVGAQYQVVNAGVDAQSVNTAMNSVVELEPDVVITFTADLTFWQDQYKALVDNGAAIVYAGNANATDFGLNQTYGTSEASVINGEVLAAGAIVFTCGTAKDFVYYAAPEIPASVDMYASYDAFIKEHVPGATVRSVDISILDSDGAGKIVSDLQAHPETAFCSPAADQWQVGLKTKADLAGITNAYCFGGVSIAGNYQQVKDGTQVAAFALDPAVQSWQSVDEGFRKMQGVFKDYDMLALAKLTSAIITQRNIDRVDVTTGAFEAIPNMAELYVELWTP